MKAKFSGIGIVDGRGKLNGSVMSKNRSGAYVRTKVSPVNPQTVYQAAARNLLTSLSQLWRGLTQAQRTAWNNAVSAYSRTNVFGDSVLPTGKNLLTRLNANLVNVGQPQITAPPSPAGAGQVTVTGLLVEDDGNIEVNYDGATDGHKIQVWATPPVSPGKEFLKNDYRLIAYFDGAVASPFDATADYANRFGVPTLGTRIGVKLVSINELTGENSVPSEYTTIVVAA